MPSAKGAKDAKVPKVTRYLGSKGLLGDKVFSRTCVQSSLTPEEGPSFNVFKGIFFSAEN